MNVSLISRPKKNYLGRHYGLLLPNKTVIESQAVQGLRQVPFHIFSAGKKVVIETTKPFTSEINTRIRELFHEKKPYDIATNNCEHVARGIIDKKESIQINAIFALSLFYGLCLLLKKTD